MFHSSEKNEIDRCDLDYYTTYSACPSPLCLSYSCFYLWSRPFCLTRCRPTGKHSISRTWFPSCVSNISSTNLHPSFLCLPSYRPYKDIGGSPLLPPQPVKCSTSEGLPSSWKSWHNQNGLTQHLRCPSLIVDSPTSSNPLKSTLHMNRVKNW